MATRYKSIRYDRALALEKELSEKAAELVKKAEQEAMGQDRAKELYKKRKSTVEPVFGIIKQVLGFRAP